LFSANGYTRESPVLVSNNFLCLSNRDCWAVVFVACLYLAVGRVNNANFNN